MKQSLAFALLLLSPAYAAEFKSQVECGGAGTEICIATKKSEFFVFINTRGKLETLKISTISTRKGYDAGFDFDQKTGILRVIRPRKFNRDKQKFPYESIAVGLQVGFSPSGILAWRNYDSNLEAITAVGLPCSREYFYDETGKLQETKYHKLKCEYGTGLVRFFLPPGTYYVTEPPLRLRAEPSMRAKIIANLDKDEKVEVLDYTTERLEIKGSYAPWAKIKTAKGEGWVYGAYIEPVNYGETYQKFFQTVDWKKFAEKMGLE